MTQLLFMCVANSARSQMAEGLARHLAPADFDIYSAGSAPTTVRLEAIEVMAELGIDITTHTSKSTADVPTAALDHVITLCAEEVCPVALTRAERHHWPIEDPAIDPSAPKSERLAHFRAARSMIRERIEAFLATLKSEDVTG